MKTEKRRTIAGRRMRAQAQRQKCNVCVRHSDETHLVGAGGLRGSHETGQRGWAGLRQAFYLRSWDGSLKVSEWGRGTRKEVVAWRWAVAVRTAWELAPGLLRQS